MTGAFPLRHPYFALVTGGLIEAPKIGALINRPWRCARSDHMRPKDISLTSNFLVVRLSPLGLDQTFWP